VKTVGVIVMTSSDLIAHTKKSNADEKKDERVLLNKQTLASGHPASQRGETMADSHHIVG